MSRSEIQLQLSRSDLYLDLGHFPGRDRLPREAISTGCPVLLANRGAARYLNDFNLQDEFKFDLVNQTFKDLEFLVARLLENKMNILKKQSAFATNVKQDKEVFECEVLTFLQTLTLRNELG